jgi:antitoxin (DNA-binding transcriptional repressor) of toxin-antitoxin stability system
MNMGQRRDVVYTVHKAKTQLSRLLQQVAAGREVLIARGRGCPPEFRLVRVAPGTGSRLEPDPALARGMKLPSREKLAAPLPPEEWGEEPRKSPRQSLRQSPRKSLTAQAGRQ